MRIVFSRHAEEKFEILARHGWPLARHVVEATVRNPQTLDFSRAPLVIAQASLDASHVLRVVYKKREKEVFIITFYPGRKSQYETD